VEDIRWCFKAECLSWSGIELVFEPFDILSCECSEVGPLWNYSPNESDGVLDSRFVVTAEGSAEIGLGTEDGIGALMFSILEAVVIGDRSAESPGVMR
jgi:hypothetical protein